MTSDWQGLDDAMTYARDLLRGGRVRLREVRESDYELLSTWWNDPAVRLLQTTWVRPSPEVANVDLLRGWSTNTGNDVGFAVELGDGSLIGHAALFGIDKNASATLGIVLGPPYWSAGHGTDALEVLVRYGFSELGLHRIGLEVFAFNTRAIATYRRIGFAEEGRRREVLLHAGTRHDTVLMGLLASEWRPPTA